MSTTESPPVSTTDSPDKECPHCPATFQTELEREHHCSQAHPTVEPSQLDSEDPGYIRHVDHV